MIDNLSTGFQRGDGLLLWPPSSKGDQQWVYW